MIIYSDPWDDGYFKGDSIPRGRWRPDSGVQRGSIQYLFRYPGDPTTPGIASLPDLPDSKRTPPDKATDLHEGPDHADVVSGCHADHGQPRRAGSPRDWQGALPFTYHVGPGPVKVHMMLKQDYHWAPCTTSSARLRGRTPDEWVVSGNHRDAWVYGAVDPNSGTAAMLEVGARYRRAAENRLASEANSDVLQLGWERRKG